MGDIIAFYNPSNVPKWTKLLLCASMREIPRSRGEVFANAMACNGLTSWYKIGFRSKPEVWKFGVNRLLERTSPLTALPACNVAHLERTRLSTYCTILRRFDKMIVVPHNNVLSVSEITLSYLILLTAKSGCTGRWLKLRIADASEFSH